MKLTTILILTSLLTVHASVYSQTTKLNLKLESVTLESIFEKIEDMSEFYFFYKNDEVNLADGVNIDVESQTIEQILDVVLAGTDLNYKIIDRYVIVSSNVEEVIKMVNKLQPQNIITGIVTTEAGEPLSGVTIIIKGTATGGISDIDGNYSISNVFKDAILVFSFIGMRTQEILVGNQSQINVTLAADAFGIEEVVAIGYGTRKKNDITGAVAQIGSDEIVKQVAMSPQMAMQGKMAGVYVGNTGSSPNDRPAVRIRGVGTLGFNDPLYVIDGIPITEGGISSGVPRDIDIVGDVNMLNTINPNDIESISVLKDASATAIYGVRASNGVILITTKRGQKGKPKVALSASYGIQNINKRYEGATMNEFIDWNNEAWANNPNSTPDATYASFFDSSSSEYLGNSQDYRKDWEDATFNKNAAVQNYNLSISGANEVSNYAVGAGYSSQEDALFYSEFKRYSFFLNSDHKFNKFFKVGQSYRFSYSETEESGGSGTGGPGINVYNVAPWQPLYDANGPYGYGYASPARTINGSLVARGYGNGTKNNFLGVHEGSRSLRQLMRNMGTFYAEFSPLDGLRFRGTFSFDYYTNQRETYADVRNGTFSALRGYPNDTGNTYGKRNNINSNIIKEFLIGYNKSLGKHNVDIVLNAMDQKIMWEFQSIGISNNSPITNWDQRRVEEGWPREDKQSIYERRPSGLQGYMGRLSYNFDSKYYLDATVRRDGTSKFGPGYKWGTFPSFAAAWRVSSEGFMQDVTWLDDLKIRAGWGKSGNQETKDFAYLSLVNMNLRAGFGSGGEVGSGTLYPGAALGDFPIVDMSWETVTTSNIGFDAILLNNKMSFTAEYYNRFTDGILQQISIPQVIGAISQPVVNLANVENKGFEFVVGYNDKIGEVGYNVAFNLTTVKNTVSNLYKGKPSGGSYGRIEEGQSMFFLYGYKTDGIFQTQAEADEYVETYTDAGNTSLKGPGDVRYVDIFGAPTDEDPENAIRNEEPDGTINVYDQTYLGKTIPGYYYGLNMGFDYKNWDLSLTFRGIGDVQKINTVGKQSIGAENSNYLTEYRDRWTATNPSNTIPRAINGDPSGNNRISDRFVEDAGFFRFQNFQLGYNFSGALLNKVGLSNLRCYVAGSNLFVISPYSGLDPENITTPTTFTIGANLSF